MGVRGSEDVPEDVPDDRHTADEGCCVLYCMHTRAGAPLNSQNERNSLVLRARMIFERLKVLECTLIVV